MTAQVRWLVGEAGARVRAEEALAEGRVTVLHDNARRRILRLEPSQGAALLAKQFRVGSGLHPWRERLRAQLGHGAFDQEWRALSALAQAGLAVPRPLAGGALPDDDRLLVMEYVAGEPLGEALGAGPSRRRELLAALGARVAALHASGHVHGDLHYGNVLVTPRGPLLVDLQRSRATGSRTARLRDLAHLDHSLAPLLSTADRVRLRAAALGVARPFDTEARASLRRVAAAAAGRQRAHATSRRRHALREGRAYAAVKIAGGRGLRLRELPEAALEAALEAHEAALAAGDARVLEHDGRGAVCALEIGRHRLVSKASRARGLPRALADLLRGSPARRAWTAGHGLQILAIGAATPVAFLEWRRLGLPVRSLVLLEDLRPDEGAHRVLETSPRPAQAAALDAVLGLVLRLHRCGVDHGDLKASHVLLRTAGGRFEPRLIDLEGVRFQRVLSARQRVRALAQLNASVGDGLDGAARCRFFARYAQALPFAAGSRAARRDTAQESLARRHRWSGRGCEDVRPALAER